jgi:hypothetical protein
VQAPDAFIENGVCAFAPFIWLTNRQMVRMVTATGADSVNTACPSSRSGRYCAAVRNENIYPNRHVLLRIAVEEKLPLLIRADDEAVPAIIKGAICKVEEAFILCADKQLFRFICPLSPRIRRCRVLQARLTNLESHFDGEESESLATAVD